MPELKAYDVNINGTETTLMLDADDAAQRGLGEKDLRESREKAAAGGRRRAARKVAAVGGAPDLVVGGPDATDDDTAAD